MRADKPTVVEKTVPYQALLVRALFPEKRSHEHIELRHRVFETLSTCYVNDARRLYDIAVELLSWWQSQDKSGESFGQTMWDVSTATFIAGVHCGGSYAQRYVRTLKGKSVLVDEMLVLGAYRGFVACLPNLATRDVGTRNRSQIELVHTPAEVCGSEGMSNKMTGEISNLVAQIVAAEERSRIAPKTGQVLINLFIMEYVRAGSPHAQNQILGGIAREWTMKLFMLLDLEPRLRILNTALLDAEPAE